MIASHCSWNHNGALIAVAGRQVEDDRESNVVQFYSVFGDVNEILIQNYNRINNHYILAFTNIKSSWHVDFLLRLGRWLFKGSLSGRFLRLFR